jgi:hypothetical protein
MFVLHWCEISSFTRKKDLGLRTLENRMLRRIFTPKGEKEELKTGWR